MNGIERLWEIFENDGEAVLRDNRAWLAVRVILNDPAAHLAILHLLDHVSAQIYLAEHPVPPAVPEST